MKQKNISYEMTEGNALRIIIRFAIPVMISNLFQQIYTLCDTAIVSRGVGFEALAALGTAEWMNWILIGGVSALTQGFAILVSQKYGEKNIKEVRKIIAMIIWCGIGSTVFVTIAMEGVLPYALDWMHVSDELQVLAAVYCRVLYAGTFATMFYNIFASILRALGNSRDPLKAILLSSVLNIILDIVFVFVFHWGVGGAAAATVIAQVIAGAYCILVVLQSREIVPREEEWKIQWELIGNLFGLAAPIVLESVVISIGGMIVQSVINTYGTIFIAGFTTTNKMYNTLVIVANSLGYALASFAGQNYGAGYIERIKKTVRSVAVLAVVISMVLMLVLLMFAPFIIELLISSNGEDTLEAIQTGAYYLRVFAVFLWSLYLSTILRYALQGIGRTKVIMLSGIVGFTVRVGIALTFPQYFGIRALYFDEVMAWVMECAIIFIGYEKWAKNIAGFSQAC
jgi:putative MATE family efflux protein